MKKPRTAITPTREENYPEWFQAVLKAADLSENSPVRGCMVIKPWGYAIWENIQRILDDRIKETGHLNAYFPLFVPLSFLEKEAAHIDGFAKECAVVTHHRLEKGKDGKLVPSGELEEPLIVRPTSEMIIGHSFSNWIQSYRDLPLLVNQWCNIVRWEMRTRMFLRTTEFLWQEGHTAHATRKEAEDEALKMLNEYVEFARNVLSIPVIAGEKTENERFPGAVSTYTIEAMMQDKKALQAGTSHFLGQNFAKASGIEFQTQCGEREFAWMTSWGVTTRLIGALVMVHSDDDGLVLPPKIASTQLVIIPFVLNASSQEEVFAYCDLLAGKLKKLMKVHVDKRELRAGEKSWDWIKKGVPLRLEIGKREIEEGQYGLMRRDMPHKEKEMLSEEALIKRIPRVLEEIQENLLLRATAFRDKNMIKIDSLEEFHLFFSEGDAPSKGGFALCHWSGDSSLEEKIKKELSVTIRCIPIDLPKEEGTCLFTGEKSTTQVIFAKAY